MNESNNIKQDSMKNRIALLAVLLSVALPVLAQAEGLASWSMLGGAAAVQPLAISGSALADGIQAVQQSRGSRADFVTLLDVADQLEGGKGHGAMFEQQVARQYGNMGRQVAFTRAGNVGTDLRVFPGKGSPMTFVQAKATQNAISSAEESLLDGLAFAGKQANRPKELLSGRIAFEGRIPADQFDQLVKEGNLKFDGTPTERLVGRVADKAAREAAGTGETAARLRGSLSNARKLLAKFKVVPGPSTYLELIQATGESAAAARQTAAQLGADAAKPIGQVVKGARVVNILGKTLIMAGLVTGPFQIFEGVQEIRDGKFVVGGGNLAGGGANTGASVAMLGGRMVLGTSLLATGAGIDGGIDIYKGMKKTNTTRIVIGGVKCAAAGTMTAGLVTGQPVIVIVGGVVYVGVVVVDTIGQIHEAEERRIIDASKLYFTRTGTGTLTPSQYLGIGLSKTDEAALQELSASNAQ
jgi:hypothetical protein